jgi:hypothetical protein
MKYELETQHYLWDQLLEPGTLIGDDTVFPIPEGFAPSASMKPLDDAARELTNRTASKKENWGRPEEGLPISPVQNNSGIFVAGPGAGTINRNPQPIINGPVSLANAELIAAENDKRMAEEANAASTKRAAESPNKPAGVSEEMLGQGPKAATAQTQHSLPGQGPGKPVVKPAVVKPVEDKK